VVTWSLCGHMILVWSHDPCVVTWSQELCWR
jgi:hypothetical protein